MSKKHKRTRETDLENPVCPGCRSNKDLYDITEDDSGLMECSFCMIRFFIEEIEDLHGEDTDDVAVGGDSPSRGNAHTRAVVDSAVVPRAPVLGTITDYTGVNHD